MEQTQCQREKKICPGPKGQRPSGGLGTPSPLRQEQGWTGIPNTEQPADPPAIERHCHHLNPGKLGEQQPRQGWPRKLTQHIEPSKMSKKYPTDDKEKKYEAAKKELNSFKWQYTQQSPEPSAVTQLCCTERQNPKRVDCRYTTKLHETWVPCPQHIMCPA